MDTDLSQKIHSVTVITNRECIRLQRHVVNVERNFLFLHNIRILAYPEKNKMSEENGKTCCNCRHNILYIGNGQVCHASNAKSGIKISTWNYRTPAKIVNVLGD